MTGKIDIDHIGKGGGAVGKLFPLQFRHQLFCNLLNRPHRECLSVYVENVEQETSRVPEKISPNFGETS